MGTSNVTALSKGEYEMIDGNIKLYDLYCNSPIFYSIKIKQQVFNQRNQMGTSNVATLSKREYDMIDGNIKL